MLILFVGYFYCLFYYYANWPYADTFIYLKISLGIELADIVFNIAEDCVTSRLYR